MNLAELAGTARLFLVAVLCGSHLGDGLAVGDSRSAELYGHLVLIEESPFHEVDMLLAHALDDGLLELLGVNDHDCRILCGYLVQGLAELLVILLLDGLDGETYLGCRELDRNHRDVGARSAEGGVGLCRTKLDGTADVTGAELVDGLFLLACNRVERGESLLVSGNGILEVLTESDDAGHNLEISNLTEVLLKLGLVDEESGLALVVASQAAAVQELGLPLCRGSGHLDGELHKSLHAYALLCREAEDRHCLALAYSYAQALAYLVLVKLALVEELLHKAVVVLGCLFDEGLTEFLCLVYILCRDFEVLALAVVVHEVVIFHLEHIYKAVEAQACVHRELYDYRLAAEGFLEAFNRAFPVGFLSVELVDAQDERNLVLVSEAGCDFGAHLDSLLCVDNKYTCLADLESGDCAADEVVRARCVDYIEFGVEEFGVERSREHGLLVHLLVFGVVGYGVLAFYCAFPVDNLAFIEHCLGQCGLAGPCTAEEDHITDVLR